MDKSQPVSHQVFFDGKSITSCAIFGMERKLLCLLARNRMLEEEGKQTKLSFDVHPIGMWGRRRIR